MAIKAEEDYLKKMKYQDIAKKYGVSINTVKSWKKRYGWDRKGVHTNEKGCTQKTGKLGAPKGNKNALGNKGGPGGPPGNKKAERYGFFAKIFPEDTLDLLGEIEIKSPLDILWENIVIQYTAIARAQKIMYVKNKDDLTKILKREKETNGLHTDGWEKEYELQFAWDKQANFLQAQSRAIKTLEGLIARYEELLPGTTKYEEQRLRIDKLKAEISNIGNKGNTEGAESLKKAIDEAWAGRKIQNVHG